MRITANWCALRGLATHQRHKSCEIVKPLIILAEIMNEQRRGPSGIGGLQ